MKIILLFSLPVLLGNLFQQFYNMVDTVIVGQYLGEDALAAVGSTGCLMFLVLGFANGIAQGFGVMVSHAFGAKDMKLLRHCVALSLLLTVVISMILTVPTVAFSRQLLLWLNTPENILTLANRYIRVIFAGIFATMAYNVASGILRGIGDSRTPLYFLILSCGLNIFLDIFLIVVDKTRHCRCRLCHRYLAAVPQFYVSLSCSANMTSCGPHAKIITVIFMRSAGCCLWEFRWL